VSSPGHGASKSKGSLQAHHMRKSAVNKLAKWPQAKRPMQPEVWVWASPFSQALTPNQVLTVRQVLGPICWWPLTPHQVTSHLLGGMCACPSAACLTLLQNLNIYTSTTCSCTLCCPPCSPAPLFPSAPLFAQTLAFLSTPKRQASVTLVLETLACRV